MREKVTPVVLLCAALVILGVAMVLWPGRAPTATLPLAVNPRRLV